MRLSDTAPVKGKRRHDRIGRMLRMGETQDIDTTFAVTNGNPHYPQIWYSNKGMENPYADAERWYPE